MLGINNARLEGERTNSTDCLPPTSYTVGINNARLEGETDNSTDCLPSTSYTVGINNARLKSETDQQHRLSAFHVLHCRY